VRERPYVAAKYLAIILIPSVIVGRHGLVRIDVEKSAYHHLSQNAIRKSFGRIEQASAFFTAMPDARFFAD
jgi:hypothetical protein